MCVFVVSVPGRPSPGRSSRRETEPTKVLKQALWELVIRTKRAPRLSQRLAEQLLGLILSIPAPECMQQVGRRVQRALVLFVEQVGLVDENSHSVTTTSACLP